MLKISEHGKLRLEDQKVKVREIKSGTGILAVKAWVVLIFVLITENGSPQPSKKALFATGRKKLI
jgi:hypothetical protein